MSDIVVVNDNRTRCVFANSSRFMKLFCFILPDTLPYLSAPLVSDMPLDVALPRCALRGSLDPTTDKCRVRRANAVNLISIPFSLLPSISQIPTVQHRSSRVRAVSYSRFSLSLCSHRLFDAGAPKPLKVHYVSHDALETTELSIIWEGKHTGRTDDIVLLYFEPDTNEQFAFLEAIYAPMSLEAVDAVCITFGRTYPISRRSGRGGLLVLTPIIFSSNRTVSGQVPG